MQPPLIKATLRGTSGVSDVGFAPYSNDPRAVANRDYYARNKEKVQAYRKQRKENNPEIAERLRRQSRESYHRVAKLRRQDPEWKAQHAAAEKARRDKDPIKTATDNRRWRLGRVYGMSEKAFFDMLAEQGNACAICRRTDPGKKPWCVDHCHVRGHVRGILCSTCNLAIGYLRDAPEICIAAADYLRRTAK